MIDLSKAKKASFVLKNLSTQKKNEAIISASKNLLKHASEILIENQKDVEEQIKKGATKAFIDRLTLTNERINSIAEDMVKVAKLENPTNVVLEEWIAESGIKIQKVSIPIGVVGVVYEARPNVTADVFTLLLKTGNVCVLKGGSDAKFSNQKIVEVLKEALVLSGLPEDIITLLPSERSYVEELIKARGQVDLVIPRGSKNLIDFVLNNATVPVIETGAGVCHTYVSKNADLNMALNILKNAKTSRPSVCNACETLVVDREVALEFLKMVKENLTEVILRGGEEENKIIEMQPLTEKGYSAEYGDLELSVKIVEDVYEAVEHINNYSTTHSETICSKNNEEIEYFLNNIDSACVYANASTRFSDGGCFGFGAEIGISTQKLHARGPMGLRELTTYKYKILGNGETR